MRLLDENKIFTQKDMYLFKYKYKHLTLSEYIEHARVTKLNQQLNMSIAIFDICCNTMGIDVIFGLSKTRKIEAVFARQAAMFFIRSITKRAMSLERIGEIIGGRDHATVLHNIGVINDLLDPKYPGDFRREWFYKIRKRVELYIGKEIDVMSVS